MKKITLLTFVLISTFFIGSAQVNKCATDEYQELLIQNNPQLKQFIEKETDRIFANAKLNGSTKAAQLITIPVVVHNFHNNGDGYISDKQIEDGIRVLNEDFQRLNSDTSQTRAIFKPYTSNVGIQFKLARKDPNGIGTNGIVRINTTATYDASNNVKPLSRWPVNSYLNIWIVKTIASTSTTGITLGYAQLPYSGISNTFGVVQRSDSWGAIETSSADGRTATHEVGHCLGLLHTFQDGCGNNCSSSGDRICDTPPARESTQGCSTGLNSCSNDVNGAGSPYTSDVVNQIENYMSYDDCQNMFTKEQKDLMLSVLTTYPELINLTSQPNLVKTGTDSSHVKVDNAPIAEFIYPNKVVCENVQVRYVDISYNGTIATRSWSFPGGTPSSSTDSIVNVTYPAAGKYDATITVSNAKGNDSESHTNTVDVKSTTPKFVSWFYTEGMEDSTFDDDWSIIDYGGSRKWLKTDKAAATGNYSAYIYNYSNNEIGAVEELISPSFDLSAVLSPQLYFKIAYRRKISSNNDNLKVYYSTNCGESWSIRFSKSGENLETTPSNNGDFTPSSLDEWKDFSASLPGGAAISNNVLFKFEFTFDGGNNIYIDDIRIQNPAGIDELSLKSAIFNVFPNPTSGNSTINLQLNESQNNFKIAVTDLRGASVLPSIQKGFINAGKHKFELNTAQLNPGIYFVKIQTASGEKVEKLIVN